MGLVLFLVFVLYRIMVVDFMLCILEGFMLVIYTTRKSVKSFLEMCLISSFMI